MLAHEFEEQWYWGRKGLHLSLQVPLACDPCTMLQVTISDRAYCSKEENKDLNNYFIWLLLFLKPCHPCRMAR